MTSDELYNGLRNRTKAVSQYIKEEDYESAIQDAVGETGFTIPNSYPVTDTRNMWVMQRCIRHLYFYAMSEFGKKFDVDNIKLNQKFASYSKIIEMMDKKWETFMADAKNEDFFSVEETDVLSSTALGVYVTPGFMRDSTGKVVNQIPRVW
jgi:hypothetical protein